MVRMWHGIIPMLVIITDRFIITIIALCGIMSTIGTVIGKVEKIGICICLIKGKELKWLKKQNQI